MKIANERLTMIVQTNSEKKKTVCLEKGSIIPEKEHGLWDFKYARGESQFRI